MAIILCVWGVCSHVLPLTAAVTLPAPTVLPHRPVRLLPTVTHETDFQRAPEYLFFLLLTQPCMHPATRVSRAVREPEA